MSRHWHPTLERIVRWLKPSAESFAAAAAVHSPELMLQLEATKGAAEGSLSPGCDGLPVSRQASRGPRPEPRPLRRRLDEPDNDALSMREVVGGSSATAGLRLTVPVGCLTLVG